MLSIKTTKALFCSRPTDEGQAENEQEILQCDSFSSQTESKTKEIRIEYFPTGTVIADFFTKPLQGLIFRQLQDMIMGYTDIALPTEQASFTVNQSKGIPTVPTQQESRSVL
jgi:hypothetical protein